MLILVFLFTLGSGLMVSSLPAFAELHQRVYMPAQTIRVTGTQAILRAWCLDPDRERLASSDRVNTFSMPDKIVVHKLRGGERIASQNLAEVGNGGVEPWVEIYGTPSGTKEFNLQFRPRQHEPMITYEIEVQTGLIAARQEDPPTLDLVARVEKFKQSFEEIDRFIEDLHVFADDSVIKTLGKAYSQDGVFWAPATTSPEALQEQIHRFRTALLGILKDFTPEDIYWGTIGFGGSLRQSPERQQFWQRYGIALPPSFPPVSAAVEKAIPRFLGSLWFDIFDAVVPSQQPGQHALLQDVREDIKAGFQLLRYWERASIPVGDGSQILEALDIRESPRLEATPQKETGIVTLTAQTPEGVYALTPGALVDIITQDFVPIVRMPDRRAAVGEDLSTLLNSREGKGLPRAMRDMIRKVLFDIALVFRWDKPVLLPPNPSLQARAINSDSQRAYARHIERTAWQLLGVAKSLAKTQITVPPRLQDLLQAHARVPSGWWESLRDAHIVLVAVHEVPIDKIPALAKDVAQLDDLTGITFNLMWHQSSSHVRATALMNGQAIAVSADHSLTRAARPELSGPVYAYLQGLMRQLNTQRSDIRVIGLHTEDVDSWAELDRQITAGDFAGTHVIFGFCPLLTEPARSYQVIQRALDPQIGKAVSAVGTNQLINIPVFAIAIH